MKTSYGWRAMKTSYGWRKVLARGRAVGSPHSDPEGHAREDPTGALSAERQSGAGTEIRLQAALVRAVKVAPTTTPRCPCLSMPGAFIIMATAT